MSGAAKDKQPLKKAQTPQGRLDAPEEKNPEAPQSKTIRGHLGTLCHIPGQAFGVLVLQISLHGKHYLLQLVSADVSVHYDN